MVFHGIAVSQDAIYAVDGALLEADIALRPGHGDRDGAHGLVEFDEDRRLDYAHLNALEVGRTLNGLAVVVQVTGAHRPPTQDAYALFQGLFFDHISIGAIQDSMHMVPVS